MKPTSGQRHRIQPAGRQPVIPATSTVLCSFKDRHGVVCGRSSFRTYVDRDGVERGFCAWVAGHAWETMQQFPPKPLGEQVRDAHRLDAVA